jgi:hypothetical protein
MLLETTKLKMGACMVCTRTIVNFEYKIECYILQDFANDPNFVQKENEKMVGPKSFYLAL